MKYELIIQHGTKIYTPPVVDGVTVEWNFKGQPGRLTFEVVKTSSLEFDEGDAVRFSVNGKPFFYGFIFDKSRTGSNSKVIKVTVYDQLYYLKNKDTYVYKNKTAADLIRMIAQDFHLNLGTLEPTLHPLSRTEDDTSLFDIIQNALDLTMNATRMMYCLYDKAGKLTLSSIGSMKYGLVIDEDTVGDFDYKTSIADNTYNRVKLVYEDSESGQRKIYIAQDGSKINKWGVLQFYEKIDDKTMAQQKAMGLLSLYNAKTRTLTLKDVLGDTNVRAGTLLVVIMGLGDYNLSNYMLVNQVKHTFKDNQHLMEMKLRGGDNFVA